MTKCGPITISWTEAGPKLAARSILSTLGVLEVSGAARDMVADSFPDIFDSTPAADGAELCFEDTDRFWTCNLDMAALGALNSSLSLKPSQRYLELVSAVAGYLKADVVDVHGWPVLSLGDVALPSTAETAGASSSSRGGSPA